MLVISIGIVALNEGLLLPNLLDDILKQTYDHSFIELLLIDSGSSDETRNVMLDFKKKNENSFKRIIVLDNQKRIQAAGWNVALTNFTGDALTRIDAHSRIDSHFCSYVVENLENGEYVVGGKRPSLVEKKTKWAMTLLQVENSLFGSNLLKSRSSDQKQYVKTMFHATYKREVIDKVGLFNESLLRTEDNEYHYRVSKTGFKLCYDPRILSYQYARGTFRKMIKQKFGNGFWIGKTLKICPKCLSLYHFVPFLFLIAIVATLLLIPFGFWQFAAGLCGVYFLFAIVNTIVSGIFNGFHFFHLLMPFLFFILHLCYGAGTISGIFSFR